MNVMRPELTVVDGRQYRLNTAYCSPDDDKRTCANEDKTLPCYVESDDVVEESSVSNDCSDLDVYVSGGLFVLKLEASNVFYGLIIGRNRETLKNLERQTKTRIKIPSSRENNTITIEGKEKAYVLSAASKVKAIIKRGRQKQNTTHFVSFPMVNQDVIDNYLTFKNLVLQECGQCRGISELLFQDELRLHLTITCFVLCDSTEIRKACQLMEQCNETIIKPMHLKSLDVSISGLDYMNDDPTEVNVLYAKVQNPEIQVLANKIQSFFENCDLALQPRSDNVKLHITLMNSSFLKNYSSISENSHSTFDAKKIIETFNDYTFGMVHLTDIHLSQRHTTDSNGFYKSSFVIKL